MAEPAKPNVKVVAVELPPDYVVPITEALPINETLVDGIANASLVGGTVRLALFVERPDPVNDGKPTRPIVCRLAMTPMAAALIKETLSNMLDNMIAAGMTIEMPVVSE